MEKDVELRLKWRQTWPDREHDFVAEAPTYRGQVGRIYRHDGGPQGGMWFWGFSAFGDEISRNIGALSGTEVTPQTAAKAVEAWFAAIRGTKHEIAASPATVKNAYAAAKNGE